MKFSVKQTIAASPATIWSILKDVHNYPDFDPHAEKIEGQIAEGSRIKVFTKLSPGRGFKLKVSNIHPDHAMTWVGGMPLGLFKGIRNFRIQSLGNGTTEFVMEETFSGVLLPLFKATIPDLNTAFQDFALGLKRAAERRES